jgi:hypothetical protein
VFTCFRSQLFKYEDSFAKRNQTLIGHATCTVMVDLAKNLRHGFHLQDAG